MSTLIIDDHPEARNRILDIVNNHAAGCKIVGQAESVESGIAAIKKHNPELVFLDIEMPDGTGFDLLDKIGKVNFEIIFVTGHDEYAIRAFKYSAIDYLLKPVHSADLMTAVEKVTQKRGAQINKRLDVMLSNMNHNSPSENLVIQTLQAIHFVKTQDIVRCEGESNYTEIVMKNGERIIDSKTIKDYDSFLTAAAFFRVHRSHIINLHFVKTYIRDESYLVLTDGARVPVARRRKQELMDRIASI